MIIKCPVCNEELMIMWTSGNIKEVAELVCHCQNENCERDWKVLTYKKEITKIEKYYFG